MTETKIALGKSDVKVAPLGTGTWAWGDKLVWGFGAGYKETDLREAFDSSIAAGIDFFDSAEMYGLGSSEHYLGKFLRETNSNAALATKFFPLPWRWRPSTVVKALRASLHRLGRERVDLYQIHWQYPPVPLESRVQGLAKVIEARLARAVGVSNYNAEQTRRAVEILGARGIPLATNQVKYSLLDRRIERNGVMQTCRELGVTIIAYSPLEMGMLTGKYSAANPPVGVRARRYGRDYLARIEPLIDLLKKVGQQHGGKTPAQVALNWTMCKGTLPIPGAKNAKQARENAGALGWRLSESEVAALDEAGF